MLLLPQGGSSLATQMALAKKNSAVLARARSSSSGSSASLSNLRRGSALTQWSNKVAFSRKNTRKLVEFDGTYDAASPDAREAEAHRCETFTLQGIASLDKNNDGKVTEDELQEGYHPTHSVAHDEDLDWGDDTGDAFHFGDVIYLSETAPGGSIVVLAAARRRFAEPLSHIRVWARTLTGPSTPQIGSQRLCIRG